MSEFISFLLKHWELSSIFVILLLTYLFLEFRQHLFGLPVVSPHKAVEMINHEQTVVIDTRAQAAFAEGHVAQSIHLPLENFGKEFNKLSKYKNKKIIFILEASPTKLLTHIKQMHASGINELYLLEGGINAWQRAQLPLKKFS